MPTNNILGTTKCNTMDIKCYIGRLLTFVLIFLSGCFYPSQAVAEKTRILTPDNGLSNSHIIQIYQDSKGYIWIATENGLNKFNGYSFIVYSERENDSTALKGNYVYSVLEDSRGIFWVGTMRGLFQYDRNTDSFHPFRIESETPFYMERVTWILEDKKGNIWLSYPGNGIICLDANSLKPTFYNSQNSKIADNINCAYEDAFGKLWLGTYSDGLYVLDTKNRSVSHYSNSPDDPSGLNNNTVSSICEDTWGRLLVGTLGGVNAFDRSTQTFKQVMKGNSQTENQINSICIDKTGNFWLSTDGAGVIRYDEKGNKLPELDYVSNVCDLSKAKVHQVLEDRQGNIWVALYQKGILFIPATGKTFKNYGFNPFHPSQSIGMNCVISVIEDSYGDVWLGTDGDGVYRINHLDQSISHFSTTTQPRIPGNVITALFEDKDKNIWLGTYVNGMFRYNRKTAQFDPPTPYNHVTTFVQDKNGTLWIGMNGSGICHLDADNKKTAKQYLHENNQDWKNQLPSNWVYNMLMDTTGKIWIGTSNSISLFDPEKETFTNLPLSENLQNNNLIYTLNSDHAGNIWLGSFFGLYRIDAKTQEIKHLTKADGLPDNMINGIEEDKNHFLWLSTGKGLCRYNPETGNILNFYAEDGIQSNEFRRGSRFKGKDDRMYFGGINGLTTFYPSDLTYKNTLLRLAFSDLRIYNTPVVVGGKSGVLTKTLDESESIHLKNNQRDFTFTFAVLEYGMPQRVQYYTQMENFNNQWRLVNMPDRSVTYTNLSPGKYIFKVKATLDGNNFLERQIKVFIEPPFWLSVWAKVTYVLLILALLYIIYMYISYRMKQSRILLEQEQQKELSESKLQFFTDVSHEIRTPLSLIISPIEKLIEDKKNEKNLPIYKIIYQNAIRILRLINQLMDLRVVENGKLKLHLEKTSLEEFIQKIMDSFTELAKTKRIDFKLIAEKTLPMIYIDKDCLDKIIFNLLSNAFKFTPQDGRITVFLNTHGEEAEIRVEDTGIGIEKEKQALIFDRFYQVPDSKTNTRMGTGIGLHLAKMMVELHKGSIRVESEPNQGSTFIVRLPLDKTVYSPENFGVESGESPATMFQPSFNVLDIEKNLTDYKEDTNKDKRPYSILIVEDDIAIQNYIRTEFSSKYKIYSANNGKEGLNQALKYLPDVIISDILMPEMDGLALCRVLKTNVKTSHIPIILLTAKTSIEQRIEGLETGADSYITKPFNLKHLEIRIDKLIQLRTTLKTKYSGNQEELQDEQNVVNVVSSDEKLFRKFNDKLKEQIGNPDLTVASISKDLGVSRIHLNRRLKPILKEPPGVYIRNYRLKQAASLLSKKKVSIAEVAYAVGFSSHAYFSNLFKEYYGVSPTEYMEANVED